MGKSRRPLHSTQTRGPYAKNVQEAVKFVNSVIQYCKNNKNNQHKIHFANDIYTLDNLLYDSYIHEWGRDKLYIYGSPNSCEYSYIQRILDPKFKYIKLIS